MEALILSLIMTYSAQYNVNPHVVVAVIENESKFQIGARGSHGEVGLMQLNPKTFKGYTVSQLEDPRINLKLGIKYLAEMKQKCKHQRGNEWVVCYNTGPVRAKKVKYPSLFPYVVHVNNIMHDLKMGQMAGRVAR